MPLHLPQLDPTPRKRLLRERCGVFAAWGLREPARHAYLALFALQHRGQESAGIALAAPDGAFARRVGMGLTPNVFDERDLDELDRQAQPPRPDRPDERTAGVIAHNRYSTTGSSEEANAQPFVGHYAGGRVAIAHNGNITNAHLLRTELEARGHAFRTSSDTEVVLSLLAAAGADPQRNNPPDDHHAADPLARALRALEGAYSLVLLFHDRVEVARDPWGWRPLVLGMMPGGEPVAASETVALDVLGATYLREIHPGEIVTLSKRGIESRRFAEEGGADLPVAQRSRPRTAHCVFEHVYFASPASRLFGSTVQTIREDLGARLAQEAPADADLVAPMPDSGRSAATGFARYAELPYREAIIPNRYVGRTFIKPTGAERAAAVRLKLNIISDIVAGQRVVVVDDSIVRGTTTRAKMDQLRAAGAREIHLRISCPPIRHPCYFGVDFPSRDQLVANNKTPDQIRDMLGVDSLAYLSLDGLLGVVHTDDTPAADYCTACYSGDYPIPVDEALNKDILNINKC